MRLLTILFSVVSLTLGAQPVSLFDAVHASGDTLHLSLDTDFRKLPRSQSAREFFPAGAELAFGGDTLSVPARVRRRGNARLEQCFLPGLKLRFQKEALARRGYARRMNDWKLVLPCSNSSVGKRYLHREAFAYRLYALLHDHHLRTIPAVLNTGEDEYPIFIIEHPEQLAHRYRGNEFPNDKLSSRALERESYVRMCLFNYMIQNTDFNVYNLHNLAVVARDSANLYTPFPYDFDYSGLVGTTYSIPAEALGTKSVYERVWRGRKISTEELLQQVDYFATRRTDVYALATTYFGEDTSELKRIVKMLDGYFRLADNRSFMERLVD